MLATFLLLPLLVSASGLALVAGVADDKRGSESPNQLQETSVVRQEEWAGSPMVKTVGTTPTQTPSPVPPTPTITPQAPTPTNTAAILGKPTTVPMAPQTAVGQGVYLGEFRVSFYTCAEVSNCQPGWPNSATVAADLTVLPRGTCIIIDGIGQRTVDDTGGAVVGNTLDVFLPQNPGESLESVHQRALALGAGYRAVSYC